MILFFWKNVFYVNNLEIVFSQQFMVSIHALTGWIFKFKIQILIEHQQHLFFRDSQEDIFKEEKKDLKCILFVFWAFQKEDISDRFKKVIGDVDLLIVCLVHQKVCFYIFYLLEEKSEINYFLRKHYGTL